MISKAFKRGSELVFSITAKNIYLVSSGNFISVVSGFIFYIIIARNLSVSDLGVFAALSSLILILSDFTEFGFGAGLSNFIPPLLKENKTSEINRIAKTTLIVQLGLALIVSLILIIFPNVISRIIFGSAFSSYTNFIMWSSIGVISYTLFNFSVSQFVAKEAFKHVFSIQSSQAILKVLFVSLFLLVATFDLSSVLIVFIIAPVVTVLVNSFGLLTRAVKENGRYSIQRLFKFNVFLALNKLFVVLFSRLDVIMLTGLSSTYEAGLYSVASRVAYIYPLVGGSLGTVFGPKYAKLSFADAISFTKKSILVILILVFSLLVLIVISPFLIPFVFGNSYRNSVPVLQVLLSATIPFLLSIPTNNLLTYSLKKPYVLAVSSFIQLSIVFVLNYLFIPKYGAFGPAFSIGIASLVALCISLSAAFYEYKQFKKQ